MAEQLTGKVIHSIDQVPQVYYIQVAKTIYQPAPDRLIGSMRPFYDWNGIETAGARDGGSRALRE